MDVSPYLQRYTQKKIGDKVDKFLSKPIEAKVSFYAKKKEFGCHVYVEGDGNECFVSASASDMFSAVNAVAVKLESQLRKRKERLKENRYSRRATRSRDEVGLRA